MVPDAGKFVRNVDSLLPRKFAPGGVPLFLFYLLGALLLFLFV